MVSQAIEDRAKLDKLFYADIQVSRRLQEEADRTTHYLSPSTSPHIRQLVISQLLTPHLDAILSMSNTGLRPMLDDDRTDELGLLYTLFAQVPNDQGKKALRAGLKVDIEERGKGINAGSTAVAGPMTSASASASNVKVEAGAGQDEEVKVKQEPTDVDMNIPDTDNIPTGSAGAGAGKGKGKAKAATPTAGSGAGGVTPGAGGAGPAQAPALAQAVRWVQDVLDLKDKFDRILDGAFQGDKSIQASINEVCHTPHRSRSLGLATFGFAYRH